jgi:hypothetical protein
VSGLEFRIQHPDGRAEQLVVDSDRVLIGSGAHCEIRLPAADASIEHVLVTFLGGGVYAQARALSPPPMINGSPFTQATLLPASVLGVGKVQMTINVVEIAETAKVIRKKKESTSPLTYVLGVAGLIVAYLLQSGYFDPAKDGPGAVPKEIPPLWAAAAATCPQRAPDQALGFARDKKVVAEGKRERSPFHVQDGVAAVALFETAAACFRIGEDGGTAKEMDAAAEKLKKSLNEDYRAHQMRLEHALSVSDASTAQREVKTLLAMLAGQAGPYVVWLSNLDRRIALKLGKTTK